MKIILVQPPVRDFYDTDVRHQPIGLCYIKAAVKKYSPEVNVIVRDYHSGYGRTTIRLPRELSYLSEYYPVADKSPFSLFHQFYHFGHPFEKIGEEIAAERPDVVGISSLFTAYSGEALEIAVQVKKRLDLPVIMGGTHVSEVPEDVLSHPCVDYVIRGEGERPFVEFVRFLMGGCDIKDIPNIGYKSSGKLHFNEMRDNYPLDELPVPDLQDSPADRYMYARKPMAFMITSRGCPHRCAFCSIHSTFGDRFRRRSNESILNEIGLRYRQGYRFIDFEDDNLTYHRNEFRELCRRLIDMFPAREMEFAAMNGVSYMGLDSETLDLMKQAGFNQLNVSLVSIDRDVRAESRRPHSPGVYSDIVEKGFSLGFRMVSYQILGLPYESIDSMIHTLVYHTRLPVLIGASPFYRTPGSSLAQGVSLCRADHVKARLTAMAAESGLFTREDIYTLFIIARIINFLKGLDVPDTTGLSTLFDEPWSDARTDSGLKLLKEVLESGILYFVTSKGNVKNMKFRSPLLLKTLKETGYITCLNGKRIIIDMF